MELAGGLDAALDAARAVEARFLTASDAELLADGAAVEALGRLVDGWRVTFAAEAERRSKPIHGEQRLSFREGVRDGVELVAFTAQIGHREAKQRVGLGAQIAPSFSVGQEVPGRHPLVGDAVAEGRIGLESAKVIVSAVNEVWPRVDEADRDRMTSALIDLASTSDSDAVRETAAGWALALDPDGAEPREQAQRRKRSFKLGLSLADGTTSGKIVFTPEDLAFVKEVLASRRRGVQLVRTEAGTEDDPDGDGPEWRPDGDERNRAQQDYDTFMDVMRAGATATEPAAPMQETVVTITADEVEARQGQGWIPGILAGIPMPVIERRACTGGVRLQVVGGDGEVLHHGRSHRIFTAAQRRALMVASGGRCRFPGCRVPHPYLEAHHVDWWVRDGGRSDVENGIMLCAFHHHLIHAQHAPFRIERHRNALYLLPRNWIGPPRPGHRMAPCRRPEAA